MSELGSTHYRDVLIKLRSAVIAGSELNGEYVLNADSVRGPDAFRHVNGFDVASPTLEDTFIIFELREVESDIYGVTRKNNMISEVIAPYSFNLKIYGNDSHIISQKLLAYFKTIGIAEDLRESGIYINGISNVTNVPEFINNTLWPRCDLQISVVSKYEFETEPVSDTESFIEPIVIIKV